MPGRRVGIRDLKSKLSECVREVKRGSTIVVTKRGKGVARLVPEAHSIEERIAALRDSGLLLWSGRRLRRSQPVARRRGKPAVSDAIEREASRRFVDDWHHAKRGERFRERHLAFESWDSLARVLTGKRMELLRYVRRHKVASVRALAKALGRDYSNVHADVQALAAAGLLDVASGGIQADYDAIETKIAV